MINQTKVYLYPWICFVVVFWAGCTTSSLVPRLPDSFKWSQKPFEIKSQWTLQLPGPPSDLSQTPQTLNTGVSTIISQIVLPRDTPLDRKRQSIDVRPQFLALDTQGKILWNLKIGSALRSQAISNDGQWVLALTQEDELTLFKADGSPQWKMKMHGQVSFNDQNQIICFHDDDPKPGVVLEVFDLKGKRISYYQQKDDPLFYRHYQNYLLVGFQGGKVIILESTPSLKNQVNQPLLKKIFDFKVQGEISDISFEKDLAILSFKRGEGMVLSYFQLDFTQPEVKLSKVFEKKMNYHVDQVCKTEKSPIFVYGNSSEGQVVSAHTPVPQSVELWKKGLNYFADYSSRIQCFKNQLMVGFEDQSSNSRANGADHGFNLPRYSRLVILDDQGLLTGDLPLKSKEGAYVYAYLYQIQSIKNGEASPLDWLLTVGSDDGRIEQFQLTRDVW